MSDIFEDTFTALEATVIRGCDPVRHCFWVVSHDWHSPYIVVDLTRLIKESGEVLLHEVRIPVLPESANLPHPNGDPRFRFREEPFDWSQTHHVRVAHFRDSSEYEEHISHESFHLPPEEAEFRHGRMPDGSPRKNQQTSGM
jgi:hypothetical protein